MGDGKCGGDGGVDGATAIMEQELLNEIGTIRAYYLTVALYCWTLFYCKIFFPPVSVYSFTLVNILLYY